MAQLVGSNVSIYDVLTFLLDLDGLPDTSCHSFRLTADYFCLVPVNDVVFIGHESERMARCIREAIKNN